MNPQRLTFQRTLSCERNFQTLNSQKQNENFEVYPSMYPREVSTIKADDSFGLTQPSQRTQQDSSSTITQFESILATQRHLEILNTMSKLHTLLIDTSHEQRVACDVISKRISKCSSDITKNFESITEIKDIVTSIHTILSHSIESNGHSYENEIQSNSRYSSDILNPTDNEEGIGISEYLKLKSKKRYQIREATDNIPEASFTGNQTKVRRLNNDLNPHQLDDDLFDDK